MKYSVFTLFFCMILTGLQLPSAAAANQVIVVDENAGPGAHYSTIESAVYYAEDGDILLIRPGMYGAAHINNKSLTLIGDGAERPVLGTVSVAILDADKQVVLRGLAGSPNLIFDNQSLRISDCAGAVLVEDCVFEVEKGKLENTTGIRISDSEKVTITRCSIRGADGYTIILAPGVPGASGLEVYNSNVYLYGTTIIGGTGADAELYVPFQFVSASSPGGPGIMFQGSLLFVAGCDIHGGPGGDGLEFSGTAYPSSDGGDGIEVNGNVSILDSTVSGGVAGNDPPGYPQVGVDGVAFDIQGGSVQTITESYRSHEVESPIRNNDQAGLTITGVPGELTWLLLSIDPGLVYYPNYRGVLVPSLPLKIIFLGALPQSGTLQLSVPVSLTFSPSVEGFMVYQQAIVPAQPFGGVLSAPSVMVIVDSSF